MKVKELKEMLANVDDDLEIVCYQNDMERSGLLPFSPYSMKVLTGELVKKSTYDRFDYTDYTYEVFKENKSGNMKVFKLY